MKEKTIYTIIDYITGVLTIFTMICIILYLIGIIIFNTEIIFINNTLQRFIMLILLNLIIGFVWSLTLSGRT